MADMKPQGVQNAEIPDNYERGDANLKAVAGGMGIILSSTLVVMAAMWGMFNALNHFVAAPDKTMPVMFKQRIVPPEPRLLPSPYTDEFQEVKSKSTPNNRSTTPDVFPWDKRDLEIHEQSKEANGYHKNSDGTVRIPIAEQMKRDAGGQGTPAVMTWQRDYPEELEKAKPAPETFDKKPVWETQDEQFSVESSGGKVLKSGPGVWSR